MDLTNEEIKTIINVLENTSVPVKQARDIVQPIISKLQVQMVKGKEVDKK